MTIEKKLQDYIVSRYGSVNEFCRQSGIQSSTIFSVFKRGINNSTVTTILRLCRALDIDSQALNEGEIKRSSTTHPDATMIPLGSELSDLIVSIEKIDVTHRGEMINEQQKKLLIYAMNFAMYMIDNHAE